MKFNEPNLEEYWGLLYFGDKTNNGLIQETMKKPFKEASIEFFNKVSKF